MAHTMRAAGVAVVGDNTIDRYADGAVLVGGNALNVAVQLRSLGVPASYFGAIGDDAEGRRVAAALDHGAVGTAGLIVCPGTTAVTEIRIDPSGDRTFEREDFGVTASYVPSDAAVAEIACHDWVHIGMLPDAPALVRRLRSLRPEIRISQDCAVSTGWTGLDVALCSAGEDEDAVSIADAALRGGAALAVVTRGAAGALASDGASTWRSDAESVELVDTTGAGDGFIAGFIAARRSGAPVPDAMAAGARRAALTCAHRGGFPQ